jgi:endonuclease YncB( thermonuclease family)
MLPACIGGGGMALRGGILRAGLLLILAGPVPAAAFSGRAEVTDGDTLTVGALKVRLHGIDAPEAGQRCGRVGGGDWDCGAAAAERLAELVAGREVHCTPHDRDAYGRLIATCAAQGVDLGGALVGEGLAWSYSRFSIDYAAVEGRARRARLGLWQGEAQPAWAYRAEGWVAAAGAGEAAPAPGTCAIKGNITAAGEKVYHTPASPWYARTRVDAEAGERWFCDEAEARAAHWRPAGG